MFGLSKLWTWLIGAGIIVTTLAAAYFLVLNHGKNEVKAVVAQHNVETVDKARTADNKALTTVLHDTHTIEIRTHEVKDVIHEVTPTTINPVSWARYQRVREQQQSIPKVGSNASSSTPDVPSGTTGPDDN